MKEFLTKNWTEWYTFANDDINARPDTNRRPTSQYLHRIQPAISILFYV